MAETYASTENNNQTQPFAVSNLREDFERVARHMYTQNLTLVQTNRTLSILRAIDLLTLEASRNLQQLSTDIAQAIINSSPYAMIAILSLNQHNDKILSLQGHAVSGLPSQKKPDASTVEMFSRLHVPLDGNWISNSKGSLTIDLTSVEANVHKDLFGPETQIILSLVAQDFQLKSLYLTSLRARDSLTGVMIVGLEETLPKIDDIELIERLSEPTGIAIDNRLLYEENQRVIKQLQQTNDKLKEIDAAKDEFISMASHQLRTPLTSMKGYVSMVLDGEAGQITEPQRSMLQQAFNSSQRMVYLISDLLNVSRLRTGKFIIMNKVTDLVQVVESELEQLKTVAAGRKIIIEYTRPKDFPKVLLDETKIRQVIMNFLDNALYYTPEGGRVTVELAHNDKTINYTVTDTGLGIPKPDQKNLFSKFFRAQNARKMRPDGTGLGLYMARKIIIAQGGAILFKSTEGEGSTFGFSFPLERIKIDPQPK